VESEKYGGKKPIDGKRIYRIFRECDFSFLLFLDFSTFLFIHGKG
jgi:hypothetical protein